MREIKFRAWDKKRCKWLNLFAMYFKLEEDSLVFSSIEEGQPQHHAFYKIESIELVQYTGLKDKKGKEIYEGDIVRCRLHWMGENKEENFTVEYMKFSYKKVAGFYPFYGTLNAYEVTPLRVIGNIYENPELLQVKAEED